VRWLGVDEKINGPGPPPKFWRKQDGLTSLDKLALRSCPSGIGRLTGGQNSWYLTAGVGGLASWCGGVCVKPPARELHCGGLNAAFRSCAR